MLSRRLGGSFLGNSSGKLGFGAIHLGSSFGVVGGGGAIVFVRLNLGSFGLTVGKNGLGPVGPPDSGECRCMLLSTAFLKRGSLMFAIGMAGSPPADRPSEGEEYDGEISILSSGKRWSICVCISSRRRYNGGDCCRGIISILLLFRLGKFRNELFTGCGKVPKLSLPTSQGEPEND